MRFINDLNRFEFVYLFPNYHEIGTDWSHAYHIGFTDWWLFDYINKKLFIDYSTCDAFKKLATWRSSWRLDGH